MEVELSQIIERISGAELTGVDDAHEDVADVSAIFGLIEQRVLSMQDRFFQSTFAELMPTSRLCRAKDFSAVQVYV